jgi:hypothetical protein
VAAAQSPSSVDAGMSAAALPTRQRTTQHLPLNLSPIGAHDKVSYKHKQMIHAMEMINIRHFIDLTSQF